MSACRQLVLRESPYCDTCPVRCGEGRTELGCSPDFEPPKRFGSYALHVSSPDFLARVVECNGLDLDIEARPQDLPALPGYFPQIRQWKRIDSFRGVSAVAVPLDGVMRLANTVRATGRSAKAILGLADEQLLVVGGFAHDRFLERMWPRPARSRLLEAIRTIEPDTAIAWGYSVWHGDSEGRPYPRPDHLYNLKRSLLVYKGLQDLDVPTIPHTYWGLRADLLSWSGWLARNPCVSSIAIDLQTVDSDADWAGVMRDIVYFQSILPRDVRGVFNGVCHVDRVRRLREVWPNFGPFFAVVFPRKNLFGFPPVSHSEPRTYGRIFRDMVDQYTNLMAGQEPMAMSVGSDGWSQPDFWVLGMQATPAASNLRNEPVQLRLFPSDIPPFDQPKVKGAA